MALFHQTVRPRHIPRDNHGNQSRTIDITKLRRNCHDHFGPFPMKFIGWGKSDMGKPMAIYACPLCNFSEGWVLHVRTGKPCRLFAKPGQP